MELNHKVFGTGDPVIILHGLFGMLDNWQTIAKKLAEDYMVYIVDQRNHGRSPRMEAHNYGAMAEDLAAFMESKWIHSAHIIGHSMGGKTAMRMAMDYPDIVESLTVIDISPTASTRGHDAVFDALNSVDIDQLEKRSDAQKAMREHVQEEGVIQFLLKNLTRKKEGGYTWKMNLPIIEQDYERILDPIVCTAPYEEACLFIKGGRSQHIVDTDLPLMKECFPNYQMKEISEAGHWVHAEAPDLTLQMLREFLSDI